MKKLFITSVLLLGFLIKAQVGINTSNPVVTLDIRGKNNNGTLTATDGIIIPRVNSMGTSGIVSGTSNGQLVYLIADDTVNGFTKGFYYWSGTAWKPMSSSITNTNNTTVAVSTFVDPNILGYVPSTTVTATTATNVISAGTNVVHKLNTGTYNGHTYATYVVSIGSNVTWYEAYNAAKSLGGYLATFTTDGEWKYVESNMLSDAEFNTRGAWIGMVKFSWFAGSALQPDPEMKWITGEQPNHDFSSGGTSAVRKSNWFGGVEPNNSGSAEGFVHTVKKSLGWTRTYNGYTATHPWNDVNANDATAAAALTAFIVEFQQ